ncbi:MAG: HAD family hydrolase, partial [Proteobacteria bacterium]|nr:HAD family hydrolase [Pseudomonadota bacterium]
FALDALLAQIARQVFREPLGEGRDQHPLAGRRPLTNLLQQMRHLATGRHDLDLGVEQPGRPDDLFDDFVSAATTGVAKPDRAIFDAAVRAGGAEPHETLHVGDHPEYDVDGARAAGLKTVWVNRNGHEWPSALPQPDKTVADLGELDRIMPQYPGGR